MPQQVLPQFTEQPDKPCQPLKEDEDQNEMDVIFFLATTLYVSYLLSIDVMYDDKQGVAVNNFHLIISNVWVFFPFLQAQGIWLKSLLLLAAYFSLVWHWSSDLGNALPAEPAIYGRGDLIFSILTIISYCLSWLPKVPVTDSAKKGWWYANCRGKPKETAEWRCRWTVNLIINVGVCLVFGAILFVTWDGPEVHQIQILLCWVFITVALVCALYQLLKGQLRVGKNRNKFIFWVAVGTVFGTVSFVHKLKPSYNAHSLWHVFVMSCAYCFSRASEYLEIY